MDQESTNSNSPVQPGSPTNSSQGKEKFSVDEMKSALQKKFKEVLKPLPDESHCTLSWKDLAYFIPLTNE